MKVFKILGALVLLLLALGLAFRGQPDWKEILKRRGPELERMLQNREVQIDPGELLDMRYNRGLKLYMFDVRPEKDFNLFSIVGSERVPIESMDRYFVKKYPQKSVKVVISNDEARAEEAWKKLVCLGMHNVYILGGGINFWLHVYKDGNYDAKVPVPPDPRDTLRYDFKKALCPCFVRYYEFANPSIHETKKRKYTKKVKIKVVEPPKGGCGA